MEKKANLALLYIRNMQETVFPVMDISQAVRLADAIADSDLLNEDVDCNMFDVFHYDNGELGEAWMSEDGCMDFPDYWNSCRS